MSSQPNPIRAPLRKASLLPFVFVMYAYATGGPFGLEDMVTTSGPGLSLLYELVIPLFWCIPVSLVVAELTTALPVEGGSYVWVRDGFGAFWGFQVGWWSWCSSFVLNGTYAVLTTDYLGFYFPWIAGWKHYVICVLLVAAIAWINVRGIHLVGLLSEVLMIFVLMVVGALCVLAAFQWHHNPFAPFVPPHVRPFQVFGVGLALGLWLYSGYEQLSSVAEEVENPQRNYPRALAIVIPLAIATYFLPTLLSLAALGDWQNWHTGYFSNAAQLIGGSWLGFIMTIAAMLSNLALLNATMLTGTRMPSSMSDHGDLPRALMTRHARYGTPWMAIVVSSIISVALAFHSFTQLLTLYIWLRIGVTIFSVLSAWRMRQKRPELVRPFRIPWGRAGLFYGVGAPLAMSVVALVASDPFARKWGPVALLSGPAMYLVFRKLLPGKNPVDVAAT
jgi:amino acid transporter